ncbi:hypothetical protein KM043_013565 [Ampulex compressa]|nr:hypothetical protein KM043_013565 [Ampulex compressa]
MERSARTARRARLRGIEGSRDRGIEGSRDRGIEGSRERPAKRRAAGRRRFLGYTHVCPCEPPVEGFGPSAACGEEEEKREGGKERERRLENEERRKSLKKNTKDQYIK